MSTEPVSSLLARQYLEPGHWGAVEAKIWKQNKALAAPIIPVEELTEVAISTCMFALARALGDLTHELELDRPIYWCVTRAKVVNAMIAGYRCPDMYCVVISEGMINTVFYFTAAMMASEQLSAYLADGSPPVELQQPSARPRRDAWKKIADEADENHSRDSVSRAFPISFLAMYFLMAHEVGHMAGGHLPLFANGFAVEANGESNSGKAENRALERDADGLAAGATVWLMGNEVFREDWKDILKDRDAAFRYFFVTAYILFSIMDLFGPEDPFGEERTHPPAMVRIATMSYFLAGAFSQLGVFGFDEILDIGRAAIAAVEIAVMDLGGGMMEHDEAHRLHAEVGKHLEEHATEWKGLEARLDRRHLDKYYWSRALR